MVSKPGVYVLGCGGHAKVVVQTLRALGYDHVVVFDDDRKKWGRSVMGIPVYGPIERVADHPRSPTIIAVGDNSVRESVAARYELDWLTIVHPRAWVDPSVKLGPGTVVCAGAVVQADAQIGAHVIINTSSSIDHDCRIGNWVHVAPGARVAGGVTVGDRVLLGLGSVVLPERTIGARTIVGSGAVVTRDLPPDVTVVGVPARIMREAGDGIGRV